MKYYPMAAIDVETAKHYKPEDINKMKLEQFFCNDKLSDIVSMSIVIIDRDLEITRKSYVFKPS